MKTTQKWSKMLMLGKVAVALAFGIMVTGCATAYVRTDPFQLNAAQENAVIVRVDSAIKLYRLLFEPGSMFFENKKGDNLKVNGIAIPTNEFSLPKTSSYEFKLRLHIVFYRDAFRTDIAYNFEPGNTYLVNIERAEGVKHSFGEVPLTVVLYKYSSDLREKNKVKEFDITKIEDHEF
ncbi:hypothetical protein FACS1894190_15920 [Spirochaetia bacterium]|nr:hypothetical protein FACS1894190_15920 [Spirochaetia bacterium]